MTELLLAELRGHCLSSRIPWPDDVREARRRTLGSSEVAAIVGVNPYQSMHQASEAASTLPVCVTITGFSGHNPYACPVHCCY